MDIVEKSNFIDKAVTKTKKNELNWRTLTQNDVLKPLPDEENPLIHRLSKDPLSIKDSYIADFNTGSLLLLVPRLLDVPFRSAFKMKKVNIVLK